MGLLDVTQTHSGGLLNIGQEPPMRPFREGEYVTNPDGSRSTQRTVTIPLKGGWAVVPSLWMGPNGPVDMRQLPESALSNLVQRYEYMTGETFRRYRAHGPADDGAAKRSLLGGVSSGVGLAQYGPARR